MGELSDYSVTVTIPIFNSSKYIDECLSGILNQTRMPSEIIFVIDNRTTDDSKEILKKKMGSFNNLSIIEQDDGKGLAGARNIGILEAKGNVLWFLDVDDIPHPTFLEEMLAVMTETDADTVVCNHFQSFERVVREIPKKDYSIKLYDGSYAVEHYTDFPIYSWSRIQKKAVFKEETMFREHPAAEDIEQTIRQFAVSKKVCYFDKPLYTYVKNGGSSTKSNRRNEMESMEETAKSVLPFIKERLPESYVEFERRFVLNMMRQSTFIDYRSYSKGYRTSITHLILKDMKDKTFEMKVYSLSKFMYYLILFPFSHYYWDRKEGLWDS